MRHWLLLLAMGALTVAAHAGGAVLGKAIKGTPEIRAMDVIGFAPGGILLLGDGAGRAVYAVETGDLEKANGAIGEIRGIDSEIAARLGAGADDVEIIDMAVNPESGRIYFAVRRQDDKKVAIVRLGPGKAMDLFPMKDVTFARIPLPDGDKAPVSKVTDVVWAGNRLIAAARCNEEFASKIFAADGPLVHAATGSMYSAETYHVQHGRWETKAPMSVMIPYEESGEHYIVGAFSCTPVVKYPVSALEEGARVKGISMIELGSGNRPLDMFSYSKDGKQSVVANTFRFHHGKRPFGPSPYWAVRFDEALLSDQERTNENAVQRLDREFRPAAEGIEMVESFHGVVQMDRLNAGTAVALREGAGGLDLVVIELP